MRAYNEIYLQHVQQAFGTMLAAAVEVCGLDLTTFYQKFLNTPLCEELSNGRPRAFAGKSGLESLAEVLGGELAIPKELPPMNPGPEYWTGWALAFFQWGSGYSLQRIQELVPIAQIQKLYNPYHEMDIRQFCDHMDELCDEAQGGSALKQMRVQAGLSQSQLAQLSGIPVRTLQQYEQRQKNINRARLEYATALANALCCAPADLLEHRAADSYEYAYLSQL